MKSDGRAYQRKWRDKAGVERLGRWWIEYWRDGTRYREPAGNTEAEAAKKLAKIRRTSDDDFIAPNKRRVTVDELLDNLITYLREQRRAKAVRSFESHLVPIREAFGPDRATAVTTERLERFSQERLDAGKARGTVNHEMGTLRQAFNLALKRRTLTRVPYFPMLGDADNVRQGFVEPATFESVVTYLPEPVNEIARFAYGSAWRKGEILPLRWDAIDRQAREVRLGTSKNGRPRTLPLKDDPDLWDLIERRWQARKYTTAEGLAAISEYVFHAGDGAPLVDFKRSWRSACKKAGVPNLLFHDLRRSAVRNMVRGGTDPAVAMRISGHETMSMFLRYNITSETDKAEALRKTREYVKAQAALPSNVAAGDFGKGE